MGARRFAREAALQFLYQEDFTVPSDEKHGYDLDDRFPFFCALYLINKKGRSYAKELVVGVCEHLSEIDNYITLAAKNWRLNRLAVTDRNILRIAVYEICFRGDVPGEVVINEAVEIAKKYSGDESPKFINGILDTIFAGKVGVKQKDKNSFTAGNGCSDT